MRKPVFQGVLGASILVAAVSLGIMLTRYISLRAYAPKAPPRSAPAPASRLASAPAPETWKNLFAPSAGMTLPSKLPAVGTGSAAAARSNFLLVGTIVSTRNGDSRAILWADGMKEPKLIRINTEVEPGAMLTFVSRDQARISRGGETEKLDLLPAGSKGRPAAGTAPAPPAPGRTAAGRQPPAAAEGAAGADIRVERLAENAFALNEADVAHLAGNINQYMTQIRLVPYFEANKSAGYRIAAIRPGTTFEKLGFQGGDVLQQVNGVNLSSPENLYTIFQNLKDEKQVTVDIIRRGQKSTIKYEIR